MQPRGYTNLDRPVRRLICARLDSAWSPCRLRVVPVCLYTWAERPDLAERGPASSAIWPEYNRHGDAFADWWDPLLDELPEYQFALYDDVADVVLAEAHTGPLTWSGDETRLPRRHRRRPATRGLRPARR